MGKRKKEASSGSSDNNSESSGPGGESSDSDTAKKDNKKEDNQHRKKTHDHHRHKTHETAEKSHDKPTNQARNSSYESDRTRDHGQDRHSHDGHKKGQSRSRSRSQQTRSHDEQRHRRERENSRNSTDRETSRNSTDTNRHFQRDRHHGKREMENERSSEQRNRRRNSPFDEANAKWGKDVPGDSKDSKKTAQDKEKPNFKLSGKLTEETNLYRGVVIKYSEPPEARKPRRRWRLYPFKGDKALQTLYIHRESAYLIGRDRKVVDLPVDHPSCSKQHAALQYRLVPFTRDNGSTGKRVRPYIIDLESANGTFINNKKIEPKKYVELLEKDVIKFGFSSREYVLLHENSKDEALDDDVFPEDKDLIEVKKEEPGEEPE